MRKFIALAFIFAICSTSYSNTMSKAVELLTQEKRKEAFALLENIFRKSKGQTKYEAAELLSSAFLGESKEDPGFYAEYILNNTSSTLTPNERIRFLRISGDFHLRKGKYDLANKRYDELAAIGGPDEKDYSIYKKAWVLINRGQHRAAILQLSELLVQSPNSKLKLSVAFDMGRFWGEAKVADQVIPPLETALKSPEVRFEFFRGLQKSLLFPKKKGDRTALRQRATQFKDSHLLIELDLEAKAPSREFACEKLEWSQHQELVKKVKNDAPYKMLLQCLGDNEGRVRKLKANERVQVLSFLSNLTQNKSEEFLHKARFLSNLSENQNACKEYKRYFETNPKVEAAICEEASEVCFKALSDKTVIAEATLLFEKTFACSVKTAESKSLRLAARIYELVPTALDSFLYNSKNAPAISKSLLPDVLYESALKKKDTATTQKIAERYFLEKAEVSAERKKSLEHYLSQEKASASTLGVDRLSKLYPLKDSKGYVLDNFGVWTQAARNEKENGPIRKELKVACSQSALIARASEELRSFCLENADLPVAWNWTQNKKLNCQQDALLVLRTWVALEDGNSKLGSAFEKSFVKNAFDAYSQKKYSAAHKSLLSACPKDYAINQQLRNLSELQSAAAGTISSSSALVQKINFVKGKIANMNKIPFVHEKMSKNSKDELIKVIDRLEKSLPAISVKEPDAAEVLNQFSAVFKNWRKELK